MTRREKAQQRKRFERERDASQGIAVLLAAADIKSDMIRALREAWTAGYNMGLDHCQEIYRGGGKQ